MDDATRLTRWQLILGAEGRQRLEEMGGGALSEEYDLMDRALAAIYSRKQSFRGAGGQSGGKEPSQPELVRWLGDLRSLFSKELVSIIQADAIERCGLKQLLLEPELLENLEPNIQMAATLLALKDQIPAQSKEQVRLYIRALVEELEKLLAHDVRRAVLAALDRKKHSPLPSASALDFKMTIARGLKNYNRELKTIVPEHFYFFERNTVNANRWTIILAVDQSGSMGETVIHSSVLACLLASIHSLKTKVVAFDTTVVDLSDLCEKDPVDLLFGFQLGGGTDINKAVRYCQGFVEQPAKTLFFLITDLIEGGNRAALLRHLEELKASGVTVICLLGISDSGHPYYDHDLAPKVAALGIPCFACTPTLLPSLLERALRGQELQSLAKENRGVDS